MGGPVDSIRRVLLISTCRVATFKFCLLYSTYLKFPPLIPIEAPTELNWIHHHYTTPDQPIQQITMVRITAVARDTPQTCEFRQIPTSLTLKSLPSSRRSVPSAHFHTVASSLTNSWILAMRRYIDYHS